MGEKERDKQGQRTLEQQTAVRKKILHHAINKKKTFQNVFIQQSKLFMFFENEKPRFCRSKYFDSFEKLKVWKKTQISAREKHCSKDNEDQKCEKQKNAQNWSFQHRTWKRILHIFLTHFVFDVKKNWTVDLKKTTILLNLFLFVMTIALEKAVNCVLCLKARSFF